MSERVPPNSTVSAKAGRDFEAAKENLDIIQKKLARFAPPRKRKKEAIKSRWHDGSEECCAL